MEYPHCPVMVDETINALVLNPDGTYLDGTTGSAGHSELIAKKISTKGNLICLDRDPDAITLSKERLKPYKKNIAFFNTNFSKISEVLHEMRLSKIHGIILDLGLSSYQLEQSGRGFSFNRNEPLDMRMDFNRGITAKEIVNKFPKKEIEKILKDYGEERKARSISKAIERAREKTPITSSLQLANLIRSVVPKSYRPGAKDPATRSFQALRIAVNTELENLETFLEETPSFIESGGRVVVLSYHSLEDRLVKRAMVKWEKGCTCPPDLPICSCGNRPLFKRVVKKGMKPGKEEIEANPRARSAMLRVAERI